MGYPTFKPKETLTKKSLKKELSKIIEFLNLHQIHLDIIYEVPDQEIYQFITEELIEQQLDVFGVPGMNSFFIYEEFHPNHEEDVKKYSKEFLNSLFNKDFEFMRYNISQNMKMNGETISAEIFVEKAKVLMDQAEEIILPSSEIQSVNFLKDRAEVDCIIKFDTFNRHIVHKKQALNAQLLYYIDFDYWFMDSILLPELGFH